MLDVRLLQLSDAPALLEVRSRNRAHLEPWEPARPPRFYTLDAQAEQARLSLAEHEQGRAHPFVLTWDGALIGAATLSAVVRGVFDNAYLGYWIDEAHGGRGLMTEAVRRVVGYAFEPAGLHRVQAAVMPRNAPSIRVLQKAGFREEGFALRYLRIAGVWEDHRIFAVTREEWR
jgi:ribosomal-protein-alanine N-acetyltransferase